MIHGAVRAYGHTMAAMNTERIAAIDEGWKSAFVFEFDYLCRTFCDADTIPLAFFVINIQ
jgi:phenylalanine-4-hydroxylase